MRVWNLWMHKSASIQKRTRLPKFEGELSIFIHSPPQAATDRATAATGAGGPTARTEMSRMVPPVSSRKTHHSNSEARSRIRCSYRSGLLRANAKQETQRGRERQENLITVKRRNRSYDLLIGEFPHLNFWKYRSRGIREPIALGGQLFIPLSMTRHVESETIAKAHYVVQCRKVICPCRILGAWPISERKEEIKAAAKKCFKTLKSASGL